MGILNNFSFLERHRIIKKGCSFLETALRGKYCVLLEIIVIVFYICLFHDRLLQQLAH